MFRKLHDAIQRVSNRIGGVDIEVQQLRREITDDQRFFTERLESIETWLELAVDAKADEVAERFDTLLSEAAKGKRITNTDLKELVRQAVKGQ